MKKYLFAIIVSALCVITTDQNTFGANEGSTMTLRIKVGKEVLTATMLDSDASRDFVSMLPLTLHMKDYSGTEKISNLPRRMSTKDAPDGYDPSVGDITYYSPWGNLAIFYRDFGYAKGLIKLGSIDGGIEKLAGLHGDFEAVFELMD
ncbi:MAG TPA: cyclophilin-like fold protein [Deltaproteobacteria bacterium]|nr:cyclophilin-like fold protein [Deltaproteobacteria bacterium]